MFSGDEVYGDDITSGIFLDEYALEAEDDVNLDDLDDVSDEVSELGFDHYAGCYVDDEPQDPYEFQGFDSEY